MINDFRPEDRQLIMDKLYNYSWTIDQDDVSGWLDTFTDDVYFEFGELKIKGKKELGEWISAEIVGTLLNMRHIITNTIIEFDGEAEARSKNYWIFNSGYKGHEEEGVTENANGNYYMKWRKEGEDWKIYEEIAETVWWKGYNSE
ncbi:MAG: nuclear transport factor 2 family protein [Desulfobacterales bacterium]|nr:nuclear transport factor 2 family protein [Desulfobacterales bacterium]MBT7696851.1 nuclear transport factor 2 family protein [Desulfobacterales bacterium]